MDLYGLVELVAGVITDKRKPKNTTSNLSSSRYLLRLEEDNMRLRSELMEKELN